MKRFLIYAGWAALIAVCLLAAFRWEKSINDRQKAITREKTTSMVSATRYPSGACTLPSDSAYDLYLRIVQSLRGCPSRQGDLQWMDSMMHVPGFQLFTEARLEGPLPVDTTPLIQKLAKAFQSMPPARRTYTDSLAIVTNYVYYTFPYETPTQPFDYTDCEEAARVISQGMTSGICADMARFECLIIDQYFPYWGTPVELHMTVDTSESLGPCGINHVMMGIADMSGRIHTVMDPTVNAVWCDSLTGRPVSLDKVRDLLWDPDQAYRVVKKYSTYFGRYHSEAIHDGSLCEFTFMFTPGATDVPVAYSVGDGHQDFIIRGPLVDFDYRHPVSGNPHQDYYWHRMGIPAKGWGWQDNMLFVRVFKCRNHSLLEKIYGRYGLQMMLGIILTPHRSSRRKYLVKQV